MIDWHSVVFNSFWILGLSILLAAFSYHYWLAPLSGHSLREQLDQPNFVREFWLSVSLIGIGLAGTSQRTWETVIWILFTLFAVFSTFKVLIQRGGKGS